MHSSIPSYYAAAMSPAERANFVAGKIVGHATAFLDGRHDATQLAAHAHADLIEMLPFGDDPAARPILLAARMLQVAMTGCAASTDDARRDRWATVMAAMCDMVRHESTELKRTGAQRS